MMHDADWACAERWAAMAQRPPESSLFPILVIGGFVLFAAVLIILSLREFRRSP